MGSLFVQSVRVSGQSATLTFRDEDKCPFSWGGQVHDGFCHQTLGLVSKVVRAGTGEGSFDEQSEAPGPERQPGKLSEQAFSSGSNAPESPPPKP